MKLTTEAIYHCEPRRYLEEYFNGEGRSRRETEGCTAVSWKILESSRDGGVWRHVAESIEKLDAPLPIRKIFGETVRMEEHASWRTDGNVIEIEYRPDKMQKKISIRGTIRAEDLGDGKTRACFDVDVVYRIFGVGGLLEKISAKEMPKAIESDCAYFNAHMATK